MVFNIEAQTLTISSGSSGPGRIYVAATTMSNRAVAFHMGQSNTRGVESTMPGSNLPTEMQDSADVLREWVWTFAGGGTLRKSYPNNVSPLKRAADSLLTGAKQAYQLYLPNINPRLFLADWNRGGTALVPYSSNVYFNQAVSSYNMASWMTAIKAVPGLQKEYSVLIWGQGEDEAADPNPSQVANYASNFASFAADMRANFGYRIPIFLIKLHNYPGVGNYSGMIAQQNSIPALVGNCYLIDPGSLGSSSVHYVYSEHVSLDAMVANSMATYFNRAQLIKAY